MKGTQKTRLQNAGVIITAVLQARKAEKLAAVQHVSNAGYITHLNGQIFQFTGGSKSLHEFSQAVSSLSVHATCWISFAQRSTQKGSENLKKWTFGDVNCCLNPRQISNCGFSQSKAKRILGPKNSLKTQSFLHGSSGLGTGSMQVLSQSQSQATVLLCLVHSIRCYFEKNHHARGSSSWKRDEHVADFPSQISSYPRTQERKPAIGLFEGSPQFYRG